MAPDDPTETPDEALTPEQIAQLADITGPIKEPRPASVRKPRKPRLPREPKVTGPPKLKPKGKKLERRKLTAQAVQLRIEGKQYLDIAEELGIKYDTARRMVNEWLAENAPSAEQTQELRDLMQHRLEDLYAIWYPYATGSGVGKTGKIIDRDPDPRGSDILLKLMERHSRLMGVDLQPNATTVVVTAESIAAFLGWDDAAPPTPGVVEVIDVLPRELGAGGEEEAA